MAGAGGESHPTRPTSCTPRSHLQNRHATAATLPVTTPDANAVRGISIKLQDDCDVIVRGTSPGDPTKGSEMSWMTEELDKLQRLFGSLVDKENNWMLGVLFFFFKHGCVTVSPLHGEFCTHTQTHPNPSGHITSHLQGRPFQFVP